MASVKKRCLPLLRTNFTFLDHFYGYFQAAAQLPLSFQSMNDFSCSQVHTDALAEQPQVQFICVLCAHSVHTQVIAHLLCFYILSLGGDSVACFWMKFQDCTLQNKKSSVIPSGLRAIVFFFIVLKQKWFEYKEEFLGICIMTLQTTSIGP